MANSQNSFVINTQATRQNVDRSNEVLGQIMFEIAALSALRCQPSNWAAHGAVAAAGTQQWMQEFMRALPLIMQLHQMFQSNVGSAANQYDANDQAAHDAFLNIFGRHNPPC
ncbi:MAG: hypothetical protein ACRCZD_05370 [Phycicoccus sp.]